MIIAGVHYQTTEEVGPCDIVHGILFGSDGACHNLGIQMISKNLQQTM